MTSKTNVTYRCESCVIRAKADANPGSLLAKLWLWHTKWCPGWKAYQQAIAEGRIETPSD